MNAPLAGGPASWFGGPAAGPWTGPGSTPTSGHSADYRGSYGADQRFADDVAATGPAHLTPFYVHVKTETGGDDTVWVEAESATRAEAIALDLHPTAVDAIGAYPDDTGEFERRLAAAIAADATAGERQVEEFAKHGRPIDAAEAAIAVIEAEQRADAVADREDDRADADDTPAYRAGDARLPVDQ